MLHQLVHRARSINVILRLCLLRYHQAGCNPHSQRHAAAIQRVALGNNDVEVSARRLEHEKTTQSYDRWKNSQEMRKRTWKDTWKPSYEAYKKLAKGNDSLKEKVEKAEKLMGQTVKAEEAFIKAEADSVSLEDALEGKEGNMSIAELRALEEKSRRSNQSAPV